MMSNKSANGGGGGSLIYDELDKSFSKQKFVMEDDEDDEDDENNIDLTALGNNGLLDDLKVEENIMSSDSANRQ